MSVDRPSGGGDRPETRDELRDPARHRRVDDPRASAEADRPQEADEPQVVPSSPDAPPRPLEKPGRPSTWWREHVDLERERAAERADDPPETATFDREIAELVPDYEKSQGTEGILVNWRGNLVWDEVHSNKDRPRASYEVGWQELRLPLKDPTIMDHLEASVAAEMRKTGLDRATLYLNRQPCPHDSDATIEDRPITCDPMLPRMLPPEAELAIYAPDGFYKRYVGMEDT